MAGLKAIKTKIRSIEKTQKVTKAMEAVSAAKMRKAQHRALMGRPYAKAAVEILARVSGSRELKNHPLTRGAEKLVYQGRGAEKPFSTASGHNGNASENGFSASLNRALYIVITSDKGLAGALNSAVLRMTLAEIEASGRTREQVSIIAVGRKANDFFTARGFTIEVYHPHNEDITPRIINELVHEAAGRFVLGAFDIVKIAYQNFISTFEQRPTMHTIFPLSLEEIEEVVADIKLMRPQGIKKSNGAATSVYTVEPSEEAVLNVILPRLASIFVYHALLESGASEHSARMVSMKSASDKAGELTDEFTLAFNKARQASITREVSEITGGMEAMAT